ncbi:Modifying wall lignin-1/2 protein [Dioscorea alata]|uniref:Modifying wall lignin-1/2 protein n=1 Tax=Dioscorea alata TaxID=55571 RepID=A0ACB7UP98_DIOAL|nr:Modifying wall lignin-1/2 protein [Dioscorea alata]
MTRIGGLLVCILILAIDIVAGILGIEAEVAQNKGWHHKALFVECRRPVYEAYRLGLAAAVLLALAHAIANLLGGCTCIFSKEEFVRSSANRQMAAGTLIISWILLAVGFTMLIIAAMSNSKSDVSCGIVRPHFLSIGGIICFFHGLFAVAFYVSATAPDLGDGKVRRDVRTPSGP